MKRIHIPAGDLRTVIAEDDTAQDVQGGVSAHQFVAAVPVKPADDGRADIADIQINNNFLSRLHARIVSTADAVTIEDVESKNGIRVNAKIVTRQALRHGDVVDLGRLRFRFIDTTADDAD